VPALVLQLANDVAQLADEFFGCGGWSPLCIQLHHKNTKRDKAALPNAQWRFSTSFFLPVSWKTYR
jgi:hypothetical protein